MILDSLFYNKYRRQLKLICYFPKPSTPIVTPTGNKYLHRDESMKEDQRDHNGNMSKKGNNVFFAIPFDAVEGSVASSDVVCQVGMGHTPERRNSKMKKVGFDDLIQTDEHVYREGGRDTEQKEDTEENDDEGINRILSSSKKGSEQSEEEMTFHVNPMYSPKSSAALGSDHSFNFDDIDSPTKRRNGNDSVEKPKALTLEEEEEATYKKNLALMFPEVNFSDDVSIASNDSMSVVSGALSAPHIRRRSSDLSTCDMDQTKRKKGKKVMTSLDNSTLSKSLAELEKDDNRGQGTKKAKLAIILGAESESSTPPVNLPSAMGLVRHKDNNVKNYENKAKKDDKKNTLYPAPKNMPFSPMGQTTSEFSPRMIQIDPIVSHDRDDVMDSPFRPLRPGYLDNLNEQSIHDIDYDRKQRKKKRRSYLSRGSTRTSMSANTDRNEDVTSPIGAVLSDIEGDGDSDLNRTYESGMVGDYSCMQENSTFDDDSSTDFGSDSSYSDDRSQNLTLPRKLPGGGHNLSIDDYRILPPPTPQQMRRAIGTEAILSALSDVPEGDYDPSKDSAISAAEIDELINHPDQITAFKTRLNNRRLYSALRRVHNPNGSDTPGVITPPASSPAAIPVSIIFHRISQINHIYLLKSVPEMCTSEVAISGTEGSIIHLY